MASAPAASAAGNHQTRRAEPTQADLDQLLERALQQTQTSRSRVAAEALNHEDRIAQIEELLPDALKGQAVRLVKRAMLVFDRSPKLQACTVASFIRCVLAAAELGLAIDGRLCHAVPFKNKIKRDGHDVWIEEAQCIPDYKGLLAVARRSGLILDCKTDVICEDDRFRLYRQDGEDHLEHEPHILGGRGKIAGAYCVLILPGGRPHYEVMDLASLNHVRSKSKAKDNGPWVTDTAEMYRKTVVKRALKYFSEDAAIVRALELDDYEYTRSGDDQEQPSLPPPGRSSAVQRPAPLVEESFDPVERREPTEEEQREELFREDARLDLLERVRVADTPGELAAVIDEAARLLVETKLEPQAMADLRGACEARRKQLADDPR